LLCLPLRIVSPIYVPQEMHQTNDKCVVFSGLDFSDANEDETLQAEVHTFALRVKTPE